MSDEKKNYHEFKHCIGDTIQLQFYPGDENDRYYVKLVGFLAEKSVVVTTPREDGVALRIEKDQDFIVRMVSGNTAKGFTASVIHTTTIPYPHMHLTFPQSLESITVRKAERIECNLIVTVQNEEDGKAFDERKSASMNNLSTAGAQLATNENIGEVGDRVSISCKVRAAEMHQYLNISGIIRRIVDDQHTIYGIEFIMPETNDKLLLHAFIYEQMLNIEN